MYSVSSENTSQITHPVCPDKSGHPPLSRGDLFDSPLIRGEKFSGGELGVCYFHLPFRLGQSPDISILRSTTKDESGAPTGAQTGAFPTSRD